MDRRSPRTSRRRLIAAGVAVPLASLVAACAGTPGTRDGPPVPAPNLRRGDRWTYRARDGFRDPVVWDETREVVSADASGIAIRVTQKGPRVDSVRVERWTGPGTLASGALLDNELRAFAPPLERWRYPLTGGQSWSLFAANTRPDGRSGTINYYATVGGWSTIATPAGSFEAVGVRVLVRLDDEEFWRSETICNHLYWYAPAVGATVREEKEAEYYEKGDPLSRATIRTQHALIELVSTARGA